MRLRLALYFIRQAIISIVNNRMVHLVGMGTMVVSLLIFGSFLLLFVNLSTWIEGWAPEPSISVYLTDKVTEKQKERIISRIESFPAAEIESLISKTDALQEFKQALGARAGLLKGLPDNPLPASLEVALKDQNTAKTTPEKIKQILEEMEGVEEVQYSEEWLQRFEGLMSVIRVIGFIIGGLLCIGILFIVTNTVKLTIYARKEEIEILKLVGATDWFVKTPFLIEGVFQGILSSTTALGILFAGYSLLSAKQLHSFGLAMLQFHFIPPEYGLAIFLIGVVLALAGSLMAVGQFFDV